MDDQTKKYFMTGVGILATIASCIMTTTLYAVDCDDSKDVCVSGGVKKYQAVWQIVWGLIFVCGQLYARVSEDDKCCCDCCEVNALFRWSCYEIIFEFTNVISLILFKSAFHSATSHFWWTTVIDIINIVIKFLMALYNCLK